jgi:hypothetical protein
MNVIRDNYQADAIAKSARKRLKYMSQWIDQLHQLLIAGLLEGLGLIQKYVEDGVNGLAGFQFEPECQEVLPGSLLVLSQSGIEYRFETGGCRSSVGLGFGRRRVGHVGGLLERIDRRLAITGYNLSA